MPRWNVIETSFSEKQWSQLGPEILNWGKSKVRKRSIPKKDIFDNLRFSCKYLDFGSFLTEEFETLFTKEPILLPLIEREQLFFGIHFWRRLSQLRLKGLGELPTFRKPFEKAVLLSSTMCYILRFLKFWTILGFT